MVTDRRRLSASGVGLIVAATAVAGLLAFLFYFALDDPRLDGSRIDRYAYGPQGVNVREFAVLPRAEDPQLVDRVLALVNDAPLTSDAVRPRDGRLVLILFRDDGLQYDLLQGDDGSVGLAEGDHGYVGALESPDLAAILADLARSGQSR